MTKIFEIYIPYFVIKHELKTASRDYELDVEEIRRKLHKINVNVVPNEVFNSCLHVAGRWLNRLKLRIDDGERFCLALSLYLSRNLNEIVFLITDDLRARDEALDKFVNTQKIGIALSSPDIIPYSFARNRDISSAQTLRSVQDFFSRMRAKKIAEKKRDYIESYMTLCRNVGLANHLCWQQCFSEETATMPYY